MDFEASSMTPVMALVAGALLLLFWRRPRVALVAWLLSMTMVPVWISIDIGVTVPAYCLVGVLAITSSLGGGTRVELNLYDCYFAGLLLISLAAVLLAGSTWASWAQIAVRWGIAYAAARILISATGTRFAIDAVAIIFGILGGLAVMELLLQWHPFVGWETGSIESQIWHTIQARGGIDRSEWALGHSIALGATLALSIPFILHSSFAVSVKWLLIAMTTTGIVATGSRSALVAAGLTGALCVVYRAKHQVLRAAMLILGIPASLAVFTFVSPILARWARGTTSEEQSSADYRNFLYETYVPNFELFGKFPAFDITRAQLSIDSEIVILGLSFGWIVLIGALLPICLCVLRVVFGRASIAEIAIAGQVPVLVTVAFITQYESIFFVVVAVAVQLVLEARADKNQIADAELDNQPVATAGITTWPTKPRTALPARTLSTGS